VSASPSTAAAWTTSTTTPAWTTSTTTPSTMPTSARQVQEVDCGSTICNAIHQVVDECPVPIITDTCQPPCFTSQCQYIIEREVLCEIWICESKTTTPSPDPTPTPSPDPEPHWSKKAFVTLLILNILVVLAVTVCCIRFRRLRHQTEQREQQEPIIRRSRSLRSENRTPPPNYESLSPPRLSTLQRSVDEANRADNLQNAPDVDLEQGLGHRSEGVGISRLFGLFSRTVPVLHPTSPPPMALNSFPNPLFHEDPFFPDTDPFATTRFASTPSSRSSRSSSRCRRRATSPSRSLSVPPNA
jgi:hypothetical protein